MINTLYKLLVMTNGLLDRGSILGRVIPKTQKMVRDISLLNTQHYKIRIKGKVCNPRKGVSPFSYLSVGDTEKGTIGMLSTTVANFT